jgi:hypothetical protein
MIIRESSVTKEALSPLRLLKRLRSTITPRLYEESSRYRKQGIKHHKAVSLIRKILLVNQALTHIQDGRMKNSPPVRAHDTGNKAGGNPA